MLVGVQGRGLCPQVKLCTIGLDLAPDCERAEPKQGEYQKLLHSEDSSTSNGSETCSLPSRTPVQRILTQRAAGAGDPRQGHAQVAAGCGPLSRALYGRSRPRPPA